MRERENDEEIPPWLLVNYSSILCNSSICDTIILGSNYLISCVVSSVYYTVLEPYDDITIVYIPKLGVRQ
jgi:hypothetical protein